MADILVNDVTVEFPLYGGGSRSLKKTLMRAGTGGRIARDAGERICVQALRNVSLAIGHGERVGLIGANGAGKTTLLRVLAGIYEPAYGTVRVEGWTSPLFDVGLGIDSEATGYENIMLRGLLLGLDPDEIRARIQEISDFTELGDHLSLPVRTYSAGMRLRLAFAVSTCIRPEILLMDEWIGVGDAHFLEKAEARMHDFVDRSSILVIASHSDALIKRLCSKVVLLDHGEVKAIGLVAEILDQYNAA